MSVDRVVGDEEGMQPRAVSDDGGQVLLLEGTGVYDPHVFSPFVADSIQKNNT